MPLSMSNVYDRRLVGEGALPETGLGSLTFDLVVLIAAMMDANGAINLGGTCTVLHAATRAVNLWHAFVDDIIDVNPEPRPVTACGCPEGFELYCTARAALRKQAEDDDKRRLFSRASRRGSTRRFSRWARSPTPRRSMRVSS